MSDENDEGSDSGAPPVSEKPYRVVFEGNLCIGTGRCAEVSDNWSMDLRTGLGCAETHFFDEEELEHNLAAARECPAKSDVGVIHVVDRRTGCEIAPDPHGDGTLSLGETGTENPDADQV